MALIDYDFFGKSFPYSLKALHEIINYLESLNKIDFEELTLEELKKLNQLCQKHNIDIFKEI